MEYCIIPAPAFITLPRIYAMEITLRCFKCRRYVTARLFRLMSAAESAAELALLRDLSLLAPADAETPRSARSRQGKENALRGFLEAFTAEEGNRILRYLSARYARHIHCVRVSPLAIPRPLGIPLLATQPENSHAGFIRFDNAPGYPLPFAFRACYDLNLHGALLEEY